MFKAEGDLCLIFLVLTAPGSYQVLTTEVDKEGEWETRKRHQSESFLSFSFLPLL
jgi:hypothetical protein